MPWTGIGVRYATRTYVRLQALDVEFAVGSTADDVRRIALALPNATQDGARIRYLVDGGKAFAWTWKKRVDPRSAPASSSSTSSPCA